jgi:hypothetical protein
MNTITPISKLVNVVAVVSVFFIGCLPANAQGTSGNFEAQICKSTSKGTRCKNFIPSKTDAKETLALRSYALKTENICLNSSRGTRCKDTQTHFALMDSSLENFAFSKTEICRGTTRGTRCYS